MTFCIKGISVFTRSVQVGAKCSEAKSEPLTVHIGMIYGATWGLVSVDVLEC